MSSISVLIASKGRDSLTATVTSLMPQLEAGDELLVDVNNDAPWGHKARNRMMGRASGDALMFIDDDDTYRPGALAAARAAVTAAPDTLHVFRMVYPNGAILWTEQKLVCGNVSTQMLVVPNLSGKLGVWGDRYEGDFDFAASTADLLDGKVAWHETLIANKG